jgi:nucleoside kinase
MAPEPAPPPMGSLLVLGHANLDVHLQVQELPRPGASVPVLERRVLWGGTACNIAHQSAALGVPTRIWSRVGDDFPPAWRQALAKAGLDLSFLEVVPGARTATCFILTDLADRQSYAIDQGPMADMAADPPGAHLLNALPEGSWVHFATGNPLAYAPLAHAAREAGYKVALDPGQELRFMYDRRSLEGLLSMSDLLFVNDFELQVACDLLQARGPDDLLGLVPGLVVTRGAQGATLHRRGRPPATQPAFPVRALDPTGAGDALRAGWYAALHAGRGEEEALRWGQAAAAFCVQQVGAQERVARPADLDALLRRPA